MKKLICNYVTVCLAFILLPMGSLFAKDNSTGANAGNWTAPPAAKNLQNPFKDNAAAIQAGKKIFGQQCATCHGSSGKGDGPAGKYLGKKLPDFSSESFTQQTDGEIFWKISNGNAPMPAFQQLLSEEQRWQLVSYIRTFASH